MVHFKIQGEHKYIKYSAVHFFVPNCPSYCKGFVACLVSMFCLKMIYLTKLGLSFDRDGKVHSFRSAIVKD